MALLADMAETYVAPARVMRRLLAAQPAERILLGLLMGAILVAFVVRLPGQVAQYQPTQAAPVEGFVAATMVGALIFAPLFMYSLAFLSHLIAKSLGGRGSFYGARLALFWALFALQPVLILTTFATSYLPLTPVISLIAAAVFFIVWGINLVTAERYSA